MAYCRPDLQLVLIHTCVHEHHWGCQLGNRSPVAFSSPTTANTNEAVYGPHGQRAACVDWMVGRELHRLDLAAGAWRRTACAVRRWSTSSFYNTAAIDKVRRVAAAVSAVRSAEMRDAVRTPLMWTLLLEQETQAGR